jgi:hypothetical protein
MTDNKEMKVLMFSFLFSLSVLAGNFVSFKSEQTYLVEGTVENKFFVFNKNTSNEQRIKLESLSDMVHGAQYSICLKVVKDCHMECTGNFVGKPKFITPDLDPKNLTPDIKGAYAPADKTQCP